MSVGCNTLLPPVGRNPTPTQLATPPARHARPPSPAVVNTRRGGALYPDSPLPSSLAVDPMPQISIAPATACLIRARGATARTARVSQGRGKARLDNDMGAAHLPS